MELRELRKKIDETDGEIVRLVSKRMELCGEIADVKKKDGLPVYDAKREREKLVSVSEEAGSEMSSYIRVLYSLMFELSRSYQESKYMTQSDLYGLIGTAIAETPRLFPSACTVACQGAEGAYSQAACEKIFKAPSIMYMSSFDAVFSAVEGGLCRYGIIPLENTTAGSVKKVYDLMISKHFYIVRSTRIKIDHSLLAPRGTRLEDIKEIFSHEQAINQCGDFLRSFPNAKITCCENTAVAAKNVAASGRKDAAALASYSCAELYGLDCLERSVQDNDNNHTKFICISKEPEIYPGADKTSLMMVIPHKPGSLYKVLARFYALGINLIKLESRPIPGRDFEFMFYFDLDTSVYSDEFVQLICEISAMCEEFRYLGSYSEVS